MKLVAQKLIEEGVLKTQSIIEAFIKVPRADFVPEFMRSQAQRDIALPTFESQTISQPYTVAFMLELLDPREGQKILDVGSGSGWVAGMFAFIVGPKGKVFGIERIRELVDFSKDNLKKYNFKNLEIIAGDGSKGLKKEAPFHRIHVAAQAQEIPKTLLEQLAIGGKMVIPTARHDIRLITRVKKNEWKEKIFPGFIFVPLISS